MTTFFRSWDPSKLLFGGVGGLHSGPRAHFGGFPRGSQISPEGHFGSIWPRAPTWGQLEANLGPFWGRFWASPVPSFKLFSNPLFTFSRCLISRTFSPRFPQRHPSVPEHLFFPGFFSPPQRLLSYFFCQRLEARSLSAGLEVRLVDEVVWRGFIVPIAPATRPWRHLPVSACFSRCLPFLGRRNARSV